MPDDLTEDIVELAQAPASVTTDGLSHTERPIDDVIKADQYGKTTEAVQKAHRGLRITKLVPPGAT